jgi:hypothetical protein
MTIARLSIFLILLGLSTTLQSCARYRVVVPAPIPGTTAQKETMQAYFWGAMEETVATENCQGNGLDEVVIRRTLPNTLATILTLGIWMPLDVEWRCAKIPQTEGSGL